MIQGKFTLGILKIAGRGWGGRRRVGGERGGRMDGELGSGRREGRREAGEEGGKRGGRQGWRGKGEER